jgi:peptidylprolyl isomerase
MAEAKFGDTVKMYYAVKLEDGTVFDSILNDEPMKIIIGAMQVLPDVEEALIGMTPGSSKTIKVPSEQAFGPYIEELVIEEDRNDFPEDFKFEVGQHLQIPQKGSNPYLATVLKVSDTTITLDKNHPLSGKDLIVDIQLVEIL